MTLHILHTLSGYAILLFLTTKIIVHYYLDHLQGKNLGLGSMLLMPLQYISLYSSKVNSENIRLKLLCNFLLLLTFISLAANIIFGLLIYTM